MGTTQEELSINTPDARRLDAIERVDLHLLSYYSACGKRDMVPAEVAAAYRDAGYVEIGFSDHLHPWIDPVIFSRLGRDLAASEASFQGVTCYVGCEAEVIAPGVVTMTGATAEQVDFALVSATHFHLSHVAKPGDPSPTGVAARFLRFFHDAVRCPGATAIAHPFIANQGALGPLVEIWRHVDRAWLREALVEAASRGVAMELHPRALAPENAAVMFDFYALARECGTRFTVGSDTHARADIGTTGKLRPLAESLGLADGDLWRPTELPKWSRQWEG
jgi:histidinol phosphatase-like PHP family hydrolase